ncbi:TonB-dependent receptor domain-containing protein [Saccharicrinis sp. FJH2]|uniref:TonB-dependent receptor n=1 Tax=Saccharicrinis sp. FJH65 TaxID=3344659 RepID=UPI0035F2A65D
MKYLTTTCFVWVLFIVSVVGQNTVSGTIYNSNDQSTIPGVNIFIPELSKGVISNDDGTFTLKNLPDGVFKVQFSFVGFKTVIKDMNTNTKNLYTIEMTPSVLQSEEVVVSSGSYSSQHENAIKIENYHLHNELQPASTNVFAALAEVPGISVITKSPGISSPVIRGLSTNNILVLNNGVKLENYQFSQDHPYLIGDNGYRDVEIIKGPASLLYGSDALGGVLNFIKSDPAPAGQTEGSVQAGWQSNTNGYQADMEVKSSGQLLNWGINGGYKNHADYLDGNNNAVLNSRFSAQNIGAFAGTGYKNSRIKLFYDYTSLKAGIPSEEAQTLISKRGRKNEVWYQNLDHHMATLRYNYYKNSWKFNNDLSYQLNQRELFGSTGDLVHMNLSTLSLNTKLRKKTGDASEVITGVQGRYQVNRNFEAPVRVLPDYTLADLAALSLYQLNLNRTLFFQVGARYDFRYVDAPEQIKAAHSHEETTVDTLHEMMEAFKKTYNNVSASAGMTWQVIPDGLIRFNLASAYRTPHVSELLQDGEHGTRYEIGDRSLKSQRNYEADLSFHYHSGIVVTEIAGYYNQIQNYIFLSPTGEFTDENFPVYRYSQSNALLTGMEGSIDVHPTHYLMLSGTYAYIYAVKENGDYLPFIPQNKLTPSITFHKDESCKLADKLSLKISLPLVFAQNHPAQFETKTAGYTLLNVIAGLDYNNLSIDISGSNLLNTLYVDHLSTLKPLGYYNPGRNISVKITYRF